jgi:hypothetical protein
MLRQRPQFKGEKGVGKTENGEHRGEAWRVLVLQKHDFLFVTQGLNEIIYLCTNLLYERHCI